MSGEESLSAGDVVALGGREDEGEDVRRRHVAMDELLGGLGTGEIPDWQVEAFEHARRAPSADRAPGSPRGSPPLRGWTPLGPRNVTGRANCLAQNSANPNMIFAGTGSGLWRSDTDGLSWIRVGGPEATFSVMALALCPGRPEILYLGCGGDVPGRLGGHGFFVSPNGGFTLVRAAAPSDLEHPANNRPGQSRYFDRIAVDPRATDLSGPGRVTVAGNVATRDGTQNFTALFVVGDVVSIDGELAVVESVTESSFTFQPRALFPPTGAVPYQRVSRRFWAASNNGLFRFEPGSGFVLEDGLPGLGEAKVRASDVRVLADPASPTGRLVVYVAFRSKGVWRGTFERSSRTMTWQACSLPGIEGFSRMLLTVSAPPNPQVYAVAERADQTKAHPIPTAVYHSPSFNSEFVRRGVPVKASDPESDVNFYAMSFEVNPAAPERLLYGQMDLHYSPDSGESWVQVMDWQQDDQGFMGQHADQHAILWDPRGPSRVWVAHDGGVGLAEGIPGVPPFFGWRKRDYGVVSTEFYDVTLNQNLPVLTAGGLQDLGTWAGFGGLSWCAVSGGDGGAVAFTDDPRVAITTTQETDGPPPSGLLRSSFGAGQELRTPMADVGGGALIGTTRTSAVTGVTHEGLFVSVLEGHPTTQTDALVGRIGALYRTTDAGLHWTKRDHNLNSTEKVYAISFVPGEASDVYWFGTDGGRVFRSGSADPLPALPAAPHDEQQAVTDVAVVRRSGGPGFRVAVGRGGKEASLFIADLATHGAAPTWHRIDWRAASSGLPIGGIRALAFNPGNEQELYVGTISGVYMAVDLPAFGVAPTTPVTWQICDGGLPPVLIQDLEASAVTRTLRVATHGLGMFERNLSNPHPDLQVREVALVIRDSPVEDWRTYPLANRPTQDLRRGAPAPLAFASSPDIRVDAPEYARFEISNFGDALDGAEFDAALAHDVPLLGMNNFVHVQVANRGFLRARNVQVHLYVAANTGPAADVLELQGGFLAAFPGDPPAGAYTRVAPPVTVLDLDPGTPFVARFEWTPPLNFGPQATLLAIARCDEDQTNFSELVARSPAPASLTHAAVDEFRQVAFKNTPTAARPLLIRDSVDDQGVPFSLFPEPRSPDILVATAVPPPNAHELTEFTNLRDRRSGDRMPRSGSRQLFVRVHNRCTLPFEAEVDLYFVPPGQLPNALLWTRITSTPLLTPEIPPGEWRFTSAIAWSVPPPHQTFLECVLVAVAGVRNGAPARPAQGALPAHQRNSVAFWRDIRDADLGPRIAVRAILLE